MTHEMRHEGPSISIIWWSERLVGPMVAELGDACAQGWDQICDEEPAMGQWFSDSMGARREDTMWKIDDHVGPPRLRRTRAGRLTVHISVDDLLVDDVVPVLQQLTLWTLTVRAELDGIEPPPGAVTRPGGA